jgi:hypothetical protein
VKQRRKEDMREREAGKKERKRRDRAERRDCIEELSSLCRGQC